MAIFPRIGSSLSNINSIVLHLQTNLFELVLQSYFWVKVSQSYRLSLLIL